MEKKMKLVILKPTKAPGMPIGRLTRWGVDPEYESLVKEGGLALRMGLLTGEWARWRQWEKEVLDKYNRHHLKKLVISIRGMISMKDIVMLDEMSTGKIQLKLI